MVDIEAHWLVLISNAEFIFLSFSFHNGLVITPFYFYFLCADPLVLIHACLAYLGIFKQQLSFPL